jgi:hypothetical protein
MQAKRGGLTPDWLADPRQGLIGALRESLPDLELVDRDLELGGGRRVDLVGVESSGRPVALLFLESDEDAAVLAALDARAWFHVHRDLLAEHFGHPRIDPDLTARVVLIAEQYSERMLGRLAGLDPEVVHCYELRRVASQRNERSYLVSARLPSSSPATADPTGTRALLHALSPEGANLAEGLVRRLERMDDELSLIADGGGVRCVLDGQTLCGLKASRGALLGWVGDSAAQPLASADDSETFVEEVLRHLRHRLPRSPAAERRPGAPGAPGTAGMTGPLAAAFDPNTPLLTAEEIAAFQQP